MARGGGSQLSQLKSKLHSSGVTDRRQLSKKSRSRRGGQDEKEAAAARLNKINAIVSGLNPFDQKVTKPKHEVLGRKIKGAVGRPGAAKASGLAQKTRDAASGMAGSKPHRYLCRPSISVKTTPT